jgi:hypothetical protein
MIEQKKAQGSSRNKSDTEIKNKFTKSTTRGEHKIFLKTRAPSGTFHRTFACSSKRKKKGKSKKSRRCNDKGRTQS